MNQKFKTKILHGKPIAEEIYKDIAKQVINLKVKPKLGIILIGTNSASLIYIKQKIAICERLGFGYEWIQKDENLSTDAVLKIVEDLNNSKEITGIIVQMPLPEQIDQIKVTETILPKKDVDGLNPTNMGRTFLGVGFERLTPCTATGVIKMLEYYKIDYIGKKVCVVGSGNIAGKPIAIMLSNRKATVTICNSRTVDLAKQTVAADILIVAVGKKNLIKSDMVKKGGIVIDIGITKEEGKKIRGDVDEEKLIGVASALSPIPGGVGLLTVACLMVNLLKTVK